MAETAVVDVLDAEYILLFFTQLFTWSKRSVYLYQSLNFGISQKDVFWICWSVRLLLFGDHNMIPVFKKPF